MLNLSTFEPSMSITQTLPTKNLEKNVGTRILQGMRVEFPPPTASSSSNPPPIQKRKGKNSTKQTAMQEPPAPQLEKSRKGKEKAHDPTPEPPDMNPPVTESKLSSSFVEALLGIETTKRDPHRQADILRQLRSLYNVGEGESVINGVAEVDVITALKWHGKLSAGGKAAVSVEDLKEEMKSNGFSDAEVKKRNSCIKSFLGSRWYACLLSYTRRAFSTDGSMFQSFNPFLKDNMGKKAERRALKVESKSAFTGLLSKIPGYDVLRFNIFS